MKYLSELKKDAQISEDVLIKGLKINSKEIEKGDAFFCIKGVGADRHDFIEDALDRGAIALIVDHQVDFAVPQMIVEDTNACLDELYANFYDHPEKKLKLLGLTGTDGKTSAATITAELLGEKCAYIGTNGVSFKGRHLLTNNTTPGQDELYKYFAMFCEEGIEYVAMETSSEAFFRGRLKGMSFYRSAISNITSEHLNVHKTLENYVDSKMQLLRQTSAYAILNRDDKHFKEALDNAKAPLTYGSSADCDLYIKAYKCSPFNTAITYVYKNKEYEVISPLLGAFNVYNLAEALLLVLSMGLDIDEVLKKVKDLKIKGRMETIDLGQDFYCLVDYAHTPNAVYNVLSFVKSLDVAKIIVVIGQAGGRDPYKRKEVGRIVNELADHVIFTADDPRFEDVDKIIDMMCEDIEDLKKCERELDRDAAIEKAVMMAQKNDIVCLLGKGSDEFIKIKDQKVIQNDVKTAEKIIKKRLSDKKK